MKYPEIDLSKLDMGSYMDWLGKDLRRLRRLIAELKAVSE